MSTEMKSVITSLTRSTWNSELKPVVSSSISEAASIPELISYLKSAFRDKEFSLVERILIDHEKQLREEIENLKRYIDFVKTGRDLVDEDQGLVDLEKKQLKDMERKCEELKNERDEAEANLKVYMEKFKELEGRMLLLEEDAAKKCAVDVSVIQKLVDDLEAEEEDVLEVNCQGSGADEQQISPWVSVDSTGNGSGKSGDEGSGVSGLGAETGDVVEENSQGSGADVDLQEEYSFRTLLVGSTGNGSGKSEDAGSGNTDFVSVKKILANCPDTESLHPMPSACGSAPVNSNVSNIGKKRCRSEEADPLPVNLACENRAPIIDLSACEAGACVKSNLNTVSGRPRSSAVVHISDSDDETAKACVSNSNGVGRNLTFPHEIKEEDIKETPFSKRKRILSESDNGGSSSFGKQKTRSIQELDRDGKLSFAHDNSHKTVFVRRCDDKDGGKSYSQLSSRRSDLHKLDGIGDDSSSDSDDPLSDKSMNMLIKRITKRKMFLSEDDLRSSFEKDPELCMNAICALYRQKISPNSSSKGLHFTKSRGLSQSDKTSIAALGEYLIDGDPENKLRKTVEEVRPKDHAECTRLATKYCYQLYQIYLSKEDPLFRLVSKV